MTDVPASRIRNFCIIAHIDHGKSTLADRLLQDTGTVAARDMQEQFLDNMDLERERGITIKLQAARMEYKAADGETYILNLIDTPGHVDFSYEVSRSLQACEGALLVVDASQGVEAQTLANVYLALENDLEIIPVLNKIDLPGADPDRISEEIEAIIGLDCTGAIPCSAKSGLGVPEILQAVVDRVPPPPDRVKEPLRALIFDSYYDPYRGVIVYFRVISGSISTKDKVLLMASKKTYELDEVGVMAPDQRKVDSLQAGEVGYLAASIKAVADARVGDTITLVNNPAEAPLPGYTEAKPMVFCGLFPTDADQYPDLREALDKLQLSDAALKYEPETSSAMGFGFRCGFLGLLHMEIVQERLEREYNLDLIVTAPSVIYQVNMLDGQTLMVDNPATLPDPQKRESIEEPYVKLEIYTPNTYNGPAPGFGAASATESAKAPSEAKAIGTLYPCTLTDGTDQALSGLAHDLVKAWGDRQLSVLELEDRIAQAAEKAPTEDAQILQLREMIKRVRSEFEVVTKSEDSVVREAGGLHVIGTERHESRRVDNQLRGRAGRQGDPGSTRFFLSLEDNLLRIFGGDRVAGLMNAFRVEEDMPIESGMLTRSLEGAQKKVETYYYDIRKQVFEYDEVMNNQRKAVYAERRRVLEGRELKAQVVGYGERTMQDIVDAYVNPDLPPEEWDLGRLVAKVQEFVYLLEDLKPEQLSGLSVDELKAFLQEQLRNAYDIKEGQVEQQRPGLMREAERFFILQQIDTLWREHLQAMDALRESVGLRAIGQKDPLIEYKNEGYDMFLEMMTGMRRNVIYSMFMFQPAPSGAEASA